MLRAESWARVLNLKSQSTVEKKTIQKKITNVTFWSSFLLYFLEKEKKRKDSNITIEKVIFCDSYFIINMTVIKYNSIAHFSYAKRTSYLKLKMQIFFCINIPFRKFIKVKGFFFIKGNPFCSSELGLIM